MSLSTNTPTVDSNNPNATLTATLSSSLCANTVLAVYNELGNLRRAHYWYDPLPTNQLSFSESPPENQTRTYTAYVTYSWNVPSTGGPPPSPLSSSNSVSVQHLGWPGTVTLTTNKAQVDAHNPTATLTATLSRPLPPGSILSIYDERGSYIFLRYWYETSATEFTLNVSPPEYITRAYTAYVAQNAPIPGPPTLNVRAVSEEVTVENVGWNGRVTLSSNRVQVDPSNPYATLTTTASRPLTGGYRLSVYDDLGNQKAHRYWYEGSQLSVSVSPPLDQTRTYTAYVAQDAPTPGPPRTIVRAVASLRFTSGTLTSETMEGIDLSAVSALATEEEIALALTAAPMATHLQGSSLSDQTLTFTGAVQAGKSIERAIVEAALVGGGIGAGSLVWWLHDHLDGQEAAPPAAPAVPLPVPSPPVITTPQPRSGIPTYEDELVQIYLERAILRGKQMSLVTARAAAATCLGLTAYSISYGALPNSIEGKHPCEALPILLPGSSAPQTTDHDWDAITQTNAAWIRLTYVRREDRALVLSPAWFAGQCTAQLPNTCDEYPFFASGQSGPGASLRVLPKSDNSSSGSNYWWKLIHPCLLNGQPNVGQANGRPFLVIPLNFPGAPPTVGICTP